MQELPGGRILDSCRYRGFWGRFWDPEADGRAHP
nr:MAG TPA: hypothetical protein [Caudoviricetes sp.]